MTQLRIYPAAEVPQAVADFVDRCGHVYQSPAFARVLARGLSQDVRVFTVEEGSAVRAVVSLAFLRSPIFGRFAESLPVADHSGPLADGPEAMADLLGHVRATLQSEGFPRAELRQLDPAPGTGDLPADTHKLTMRLDLPATPDEFWSGLKAKVRNLARKGEKAGLVCTRGGREFLDDFYPVYARNLRDLGTPCYPRSLFEAWIDEFPDAVRIHLAREPGGESGEKSCGQSDGQSYGQSYGQVVAVGFTFRHGDLQQIPFAASLREARPISPNMFLYREMLEYSIESGCKVFDFGRSTRDSGTWRFKRQWGAQEYPLVWSSVGGKDAVVAGGPRREDSRFALATRVWQKLPVPVATWLGGRIVRFLP